MGDPRPPPEAEATMRARLEQELRRAPATAKDLSGLLGLSEKDVPEHLAHVERSLRARGERLSREPASCLACGFVFKHRDRLTKPGRCPECNSTRIEPPVFFIAARSEPADAVGEPGATGDAAAADAVGEPGTPGGGAEQPAGSEAALPGRERPPRD